MQWDARLGAVGFKNRRSRGCCLAKRCGEKSKMDLANIKDATEWFEVLQTSKRSQTAMMTLPPGDETGRKPEAHRKSDQVLLMLSGKLSGTVGAEKVTLKKGDILLIRAGTPHRFKNPGRQSAVTFNVYSPPEYPPGMKG
jgi:mannose-6-phosphate isomerase-like protein (cupin superfamily)